MIWYAFYYLRSGNAVGPILTAPEPTRGRHSRTRSTEHSALSTSLTVGSLFNVAHKNNAY